MIPLVRWELLQTSHAAPVSDLAEMAARVSRVGIASRLSAICVGLVCSAACLPAIAEQGAEKPPSRGAGERASQEAETAPRKTSDKTRDAATDPAQADEDYAFQGEYMGPAAFGNRHGENLGLQVIALGSGRFDAILLRGGLPGAGWDRVGKTTLSGQQHEGAVSLEGARCNVHLVPTEAVVRDARGAELGRLRKIHRISATQDASPPFGALVLFDGTHTQQFEGGRMTPQGLLEVGPLTKVSVGDFRMHLEFRTPYMPHARGQGRGNSGVYIQQRYELQILDSFGLEGETNECGGLYKQRGPWLNMCLPPLSWQTYDIFFSAARWDSRGAKVANARITVLHNGEPIHQDYELLGKTGAGKPEGPDDRPILLQNHGNPVHFRNLWIEVLRPAACQPEIWQVCPPSPFTLRRAGCWLPRTRW